MRLTAPFMLALLACGGDPSGDAVLSSSIGATFAGQNFGVGFGFATVVDGDNVILLGDGGFRCGAELEELPPPGHSITFQVSSLNPGTFNNVFIEMFSNSGGIDGISSSGGTVTISGSDEDSVAGGISYEHTDDENRTFSIEGEFEVIRCLDDE